MPKALTTKAGALLDSWGAQTTASCWTKHVRIAAAKRGDFQATCRRLFAAGVPSDQCYCAAKALILSVRSEA